MPGPTRFFASNAARQRAYRQRKREDLAAEQQDAGLTASYAVALQGAVQVAAGAGDPLAQSVQQDDAFDTLRALVDHFYDQAGTPAAARPWWRS